MTKQVFSHFKLQGEWAELLFMARAAELGLSIVRPWGDSSPYDVGLVRSEKAPTNKRRQRPDFLRIQIKSTRCRHSAGAVAASGGLDLDAEEVGTLAAFVGGGFLRSDQTDVVRGRVSPGTDDGETEFGGAGHEEKLGAFALKLEVRENVVCHLGSQSQK